MKIAETVTFGGSGLDRAAEWRSQAEDLRKAPGATAIPFWRGKPVIAGMGRLGRLPTDHRIFADAADWILLGRENGAPVFAADLPAWAADGQDLSTLGAFADRSEQQHPFLPDSDRFAELRAVMTTLSPRDAELAATAKAVLGWHATHRFCANCGTESRISDGGWQRHCPSCGRRHFPRTDPVVIMLITQGNDALIGRSPGWPEGMYSLLAGFVEPGETVEAAVRRETFEEAGIRIGPVSYLASQPWPFPASLMIACHGKALTREITLDPVELDDALWLPREEMAEVFAGRHPSILPARSGAIAHFILRNWLADRLD
ncbi:NAD(+) diphosphatase [Aestuariibius sp. 2305UL40-4]|uniref:NAD(+) diphosphatase n=1 Tax=Aestuariibius violaceus TaxID=3234132 RepID=UPI00345E4B1E